MINKKGALKNLFLFSVLLFKLPSFSIVPNVSDLSYSQVIARGIVIILFMVAVFLRKNHYKISSLFNKPVTILILVLFVSQSISIIQAININAFLIRYKDIIIGLLAFIIFYSFRKEKKSFFKILIIASVISTLYQLIIYYLPNHFQAFITPFVYDKQATLTLLNQSRERVFVESFDEITIPILLSNPLTNLNNIFLTLLIIIVSILSGWRTRLLMAIFSLSISIIFLRLNRHYFSKHLFLGSIYFAIIVLFFYFFLQNFSSFDRLSTTNPENTSSIISRINQINKGIEFGNRYYFGVGLGNYFDNLNLSEKNLFVSFNRNDVILSMVAQEYIHNNLVLCYAESGIISLLIFSLLIFIFFINDLNKLIKSTNKDNKLLIIIFWTLFIHGFFNPPIAASYQFFFWGIRGMLIRS